MKIPARFAPILFSALLSAIMVAIVSADKADAALKFIKAQQHKAWIIGEVVKGKGEARVV